MSSEAVSAPAMAHATPDSLPVAKNARIDSLDVVRGFALLGIYLMNIIGFGHGFSGYFAPASYGEMDQVSEVIWGFNQIFSHGTMRAIFATLFGAGVILLTRRLEERPGALSAADVHYRRVIWLMIFGAIDGYLLLWRGDILYAYGMMALFLYPLRNVSPLKLIAMAVVVFSISFGMQIDNNGDLNDRYATYEEAIVIRDADGELTETQETAIKRIEGMYDFAAPDGEFRTGEIEARLAGYAENFSYNAPFFTGSAVRGVIPFYIMDSFWFMLLGMALFKIGLLSAALSNRVYLAMMVIGYAGGLAIRLPFVMEAIAGGFDQIYLMKNNWLFHPGRLLIATGHVGLVILIVKNGWFKRLTNVLASVGRMAFTNYLLHSVIGILLFYGSGLALFGELLWYELYYVVAAVWAFNMVTSHLWLKTYRFGPLEWLWRSLTYGQLQPLRRAPATGPQAAENPAAV